MSQHANTPDDFTFLDTLWHGVFHTDLTGGSIQLRALLSIPDKENTNSQSTMFSKQLKGERPWDWEIDAFLDYHKDEEQYASKWLEPLWNPKKTKIKIRITEEACLRAFKAFTSHAKKNTRKRSKTENELPVALQAGAYLERVQNYCSKTKDDSERQEWIAAGLYVLTAHALIQGSVKEMTLHLPPKEYDPVNKAGNTPITIADAAMCSPGLQAEIEQRLTGHKLAPRLAGASDGFIMFDCRKALIERAVDELKNNTPLLILHGLGGIGKTETAIQIGLRIHNRTPAYLVNWTESTSQTLAGLFGKPELPMDQAAMLNRSLQILQEEFKGSVLILDNFFREDKSLEELQNEPAFQQLRDLSPDIRLLLTTRYRGNQEWYVEPPSEDDLLKLMQRYLKNHEEEENVLRALIDRVERHTLTVKLIAQTLEAEEGRLSGQQLLELLDSKELAQAQMSPVGDDKDRSHYHARIYGHLQKLFNHSGLNESQRQMMAIACLLPEGGMDLPLLRSALSESLDQARQQLQNRGWLDRRGELLTIHPLIAQVCMEIREPEVIDEFLSELEWSVFNFLRGENKDKTRMHAQVAKTFVNAALSIKSPQVWFDAWYEYMTAAALAANESIDHATELYQKAERISGGFQNGRNLPENEKKGYIMILETVAGLFWKHKEYLLAAKCAEEALRTGELEPNLGYDCDHMYSFLAAVYAELKNAKMVFKYSKQLLQQYDAEKMAEELKTDFAKELLSCGEDPIKMHLDCHVWQMIECSNTPEEKVEAAACLQHLRELGIASQWWEQALAAK